MQVLKKDRISQKDVAKLLAEKDEIIVDLREEGENLSRQAGKHSEIIKKLRAKEKSLEKELNSTKNSLEERTKVLLRPGMSNWRPYCLSNAARGNISKP